MKVIKLLLVFVVIVGGIFLAIEWSSIFPSTPKSEDFPKENKLDITQECDKIREAWELYDGWNEDAYTLLRSDIEQSRGMGLFSREGYNTVNNCLRENSINKACNGYHNALGKDCASFSHNAVQKSYDGVVKLMELEKLDDTEQRVAKVLDIHCFYTDVKKFIENRHGVYPRFRTDNADWTSFATLRSIILKEGRKYREDPRFKKLEHIPDFSLKVSEEYLSDEIEGYRYGFYSNLSSQIIAYFQELEPTEDRVNLLNQIYKNFVSQERSTGVSKLAEFKVSYVVPEEQDSI